MIWLSIATSSDPCSLALSDDKGLLVEATFRHRMRLSERLISDVDALLNDAGIELHHVDAFAVDIGPGSFTGVRIGVTTAKTWADHLNKPLVGVSALEAIASGYCGLGFDLVVPTIRARPGAFYFAGFNGMDGKEELPAAWRPATTSQGWCRDGRGGPSSSAETAGLRSKKT
jgi:universal bacterial protein YeaZ